MTDLSETIARLEDGIALETNHPGSVRISPECARSLLATARRVQAMEAVGGAVARVRALLAAEEAAEEENDGDLQAAVDRTQMEFPELLPVILDLASDQSAARARVAELESALTKMLERTLAAETRVKELEEVIP